VASILAIPVVDAMSGVLLVVARVGSFTILRLMTLALAQALDLATFAVMIDRYGVAAEANPLIADMFVSQGIHALVLAKLALVVAIGALSIAAVAKERAGAWKVVGGVPLALAITAGLIGAITNTAVILS
jgi:hypothetical protein